MATEQKDHLLSKLDSVPTDRAGGASVQHLLIHHDGRYVGSILSFHTRKNIVINFISQARPQAVQNFSVHQALHGDPSMKSTINHLILMARIVKLHLNQVWWVLQVVLDQLPKIRLLKLELSNRVYPLTMIPYVLHHSVFFSIICISCSCFLNYIFSFSFQISFSFSIFKLSDMLSSC